MKILGYFFLFTFWMLSARAQPSFSVYVEFQLVDEKGIVDYDRFCSEYKLSYYRNSASLSPCDSEHTHRRSFYQDSLQTYNLRGTIVYNDFEWLIVRGLDSMMIVCPSFGGGSHRYSMGILKFEPGYYRCYQSNLDSLDLPRARQDYFNQQATQLRFDRENFTNYQQHQRYQRFLQLLRYYGFPLDDWRDRNLNVFKQ